MGSCCGGSTGGGCSGGGCSCDKTAPAGNLMYMGPAFPSPFSSQWNGSDVMVMTQRPRSGRRLSDYGPGGARPAGALPGGLTETQWNALSQTERVALIDRDARSDTARSELITAAIREGNTALVTLMGAIIARDAAANQANAARAAELEKQRLAVEQARIELAAVQANGGKGIDTYNLKAFDGAGSSTGTGGSGTGPLGNAVGSAGTGGSGAGPLGTGGSAGTSGGGASGSSGTSGAAGAQPGAAETAEMSTTTKWLIAGGVVAAIAIVYMATQKKGLFKNPIEPRANPYAQNLVYLDAEGYYVEPEYLPPPRYRPPVQQLGHGQPRDAHGRFLAVR